ncbi:hypothetical protein mRhiFer1_008106 [Rhinolophus ferrumequinum]|uniref:Uncharacterized protein n=1 Tax=Rhinolophus ferrumequinum TaxID=59479 RepID=A0A7J7W7C2_RHIFE|nr:hypothetical protein mRhiFer1_008106 [Rhinolophus ferrumequinum]
MCKWYKSHSIHEPSSLPLEGNKCTSSFWRFYANSRKESALFLLPFPLLVDLRVIRNTEIDDFLKLFCETFTDYFLTGEILGTIIAPSTLSTIMKTSTQNGIMGRGEIILALGHWDLLLALTPTNSVT